MVDWAVADPSHKPTCQISLRRGAPPDSCPFKRRFARPNTRLEQALSVCEDSQVDDGGVEKPGWVDEEGLQAEGFHNHG
jgi:hypothetical protein